jgi:Flp pilus assembly protein TadD
MSAADPDRESQVKPLEPPDSHHLSAAAGWLELGDPAEAEAEMEQIATRFHAHPHVLVTRYEICAKAGEWKTAAEIAHTLTQLEPSRPGAWISLAYAVRRKPGGGIPQARAIPLQIRQAFPKEQIIAYNLACYECQLGDLNAAKSWLDEACALGDGNKIELMALEDPDLKPLWPNLRKTHA